ncbi:hypothetical protein ISKNVORF064 [Infectious spleen and kidney necrosis virus]
MEARHQGHASHVSHCGQTQMYLKNMLPLGTSYVDTAMAGQPGYALVSFVAAGFNNSLSQELCDMADSGDCSGLRAAAQKLRDQTLFAVCKIRGVADSAESAANIARHIVRNVDSSLPVYTVRIGHPFPVTTKTGVAAERDAVNIQAEMDDTMEGAHRRAAEKQEQERQDVMRREAEFKAQASAGGGPEDTPGTMEHYMCLRYKYASLRKAEDDLLARAADVAKKHMAVRAQIQELGDTPHRDNYMQVFKERLGPAVDTDPLFAYLGLNI